MGTEGLSYREAVERTGVFVRLSARTRDEALQELVNALAAAGKLGNADPRDVCRSAVERENIGTTGFGYGLALPRARHPDIPRLVAPIGVSEAGIYFHSRDRQPVHVLFFLAVAPDTHEYRRDFLSVDLSLCRSIRPGPFIDNVIRAKSVDQFIALLGESDGDEDC
jgi:mannitol/fructose-specific phosphotransferase system IIA component (Ntr-type)